MKPSFKFFKNAIQSLNKKVTLKILFKNKVTLSFEKKYNLKMRVSRIFLKILINLSLMLTICLAQSPQSLANIIISFVNNGTHTSFTLTSTQGGSVANTWMAVGLNNIGAMVRVFDTKNTLTLSFSFILR